MSTPLRQNAGLPIDLNRKIRQILARHLANRHYRLYLFGSRAAGTATVRSDYDLAIQTDAPLPLAILAALRADMEELPVMQRIELVDLAACAPDFAQRALATSQLVDER